MPCPSAYAGSHSQTAIREYNQAVGFFNGKQYDDAIAHLNDALSADGDFAEAYYLRGACRYSLKGYDGAVMDLSDAIRLDGSLVDARALRGLVYYETDQYDPALEDLNAVLDRKPQDAQSVLVRGVIGLKRDDADGARRDFRTFLKLRPNDPLAPKLRKMLASLGDAAAEKAETETAPDAVTEPSAPKRPRSASAPAGSGSDATPSITARALADKFGHDLLLGEQGPMVGDIERRKTISPADQ